MDILSGEALFAMIFRFRETLPLNEIFEAHGMDSRNYVSNSGSFLIISVGLWAWFAVNKALIFLCEKLARVPVLRRSFITGSLGRWLDSGDSSVSGVCKSLQKLFMETYFDNAVATMLALHGLVEDRANLKLYWLTPDDVLSSVITIMMAIGILAYPAWARIRLGAMANMLPEERLQSEHWGVLCEGLNPADEAYYAYNYHFLLRRLALAFTVVVFHKMPLL